MLSMDHKTACDILQLAHAPMPTYAALRKQYKKLALLSHPDRQPSPNASKFVEIKQAYDVLHASIAGGGGGDSDSDTSTPVPAYKTVLMQFIKIVVPPDYFTQEQGLVFYNTIEKIIGNCEIVATKFMEKMDIATLQKIHSVLNTHAGTLGISSDLVAFIENVIRAKQQVDDAAGAINIVLYPTLDNLFEEKVFKLTTAGQVFLVPLWFRELVYDTADGKVLAVTCVPLLPANFDISETNDIIIYVTYSVLHIWSTAAIEVAVCGQSLAIDTKHICFTKTPQKFEFIECGIPVENDAFDTCFKSNIYIYLSIVD